jgi:hypothetical protein
MSTLSPEMKKYLHEIKDSIPLTPERIIEIRHLSHDEKMNVIIAFDEVVQSLVEFILYDKDEVFEYNPAGV